MQIEKDMNMAWLMDNIGTIVILLILIAVVTIVIISMVNKKKKGKSSCGCGCSNCAMSDSCHKKQL